MLTFFKISHKSIYCAVFILLAMFFLSLLTYSSAQALKNNVVSKLKDIPLITIVIAADSINFKSPLSQSNIEKLPDKIYVIFENPSSEQLWIKLYSQKQKPTFFVIPPRGSYEYQFALVRKDFPVIDVISPSNNTFWPFGESKKEK